MHITSNKELYSGKLLKSWSEKSGLLPIEKYFIETYLSNKKGKILEAGTGGGRLIFEIEKLGFNKLYAFDYVDKMIAICNQKKAHFNSHVNFTTANALNLGIYKDYKFDYLIYLQQVLCFVGKDKLPVALKEAHKLGDEDAIFLFSFLNWHSKWYNPVLSLLVNGFRILQNKKPSWYELPWLNINGKINWKFLAKNQPVNVWFKEKIIMEILKKNNFEIIELQTKVKGDNKVGHIHVACKKIKVN
jgi:SAM-dependent methyltransferase